mgnify:CR=1 FL=1
MILKNKVYDISTTISRNMAIYPGDISPKITVQQDYSKDGCRVSKLTLGSHTGTHVDAPKHFLKDGLAIDEVSIDTLLGPARVIEVSPGIIKKKDIPQDLKSGEILLFKTKDNSESCYIDDKVADYLIYTGIKALGCDSLSIESPEGTGIVHQKLLSKPVIIIEGLDLKSVPPGNYFFVCLPLKIKGCDGAPARAILMDLK